MEHDELAQQETLVRRAQAGDALAFNQLAQRYRGALIAVAFVRTSDRDAAEDMVQDVLAQAWRKLPALSSKSAFLPWLKAIAANACHTWHRRRMSAVSLEGTANTNASGQTPLDLVMAREKQRALRHALVQLSEANRIALLMHVWEGTSYQDIADYTGVAVTTVEGRIYRAKRQLRRLLWENAPDFFEKPLSAKYPQKYQNTEKPMKTNAPTLSRALGLIQFTERFTTLVDCGVSLVRSLSSLEELPPPYGDAARLIRLEIEQGAPLLSAEMKKYPELFPKAFVGLIRAGGVGGILEETLRRASHLMTKAWRAAAHNPAEPILFFILPSSHVPPVAWTMLSAYQQSALRLLFCETWGVLLASGVPILQSLDIMADIMPAPLNEGVKMAREQVRYGEPIISVLEGMAFLPRFALELIAIGEEAGTLDTVLHRAAEVFEQELERGAANL